MALLRALFFAAVFFGLEAGSGAAAYRPGPTVLAGLPPVLGAELGFVPGAEVDSGRWPAALLERVRVELGAGGGVLAVGQTDPIGPQALNDALGLQLAARAARRLAGELGGELTRLAIASRGEVADTPPGVNFYTWQPPAAVPATPAEAARLVVLEPLPGVANRGEFWGIWQGDAARVLWAPGGAADAPVWQVPPHEQMLRLPVPGRSGVVALAAGFAVGAGEAHQVEVALPAEEPSLRLRVGALEPGWVQVWVRVPAGYRQPRVWAGGIPYPLVPDARGEAAAALVRVGAESRAYAQAVGPRGEVVVGPSLLLPDDGAPLPEFVAVLVWEGEGVDLDLHLWDGPRHTHQASPDAAYSAGAVPGMHLLFDGDAGQPASAVVGWGQPPRELAARCYSDLGGKGAVAWCYVLEHPDDPLRVRRRIFGPRRLSEAPTLARWPVLGPAAVAGR